MYFGLLSILTPVGVAESEKRVAAIFLLPVWSVASRGRSFLRYSGPYGRRIAESGLEMRSMRKLGAPSRNLWTGAAER